MTPTEAIKTAETLGRKARIHMTAKAPCQCRELLPLLQEFNGPFGGTNSKTFRALLVAWSKGWHSEHIRITNEELGI